MSKLWTELDWNSENEVFKRDRKVYLENEDPGYGGLAQLGERLPCKQGVMSSNLTISIRKVNSDIVH